MRPELCRVSTPRTGALKHPVVHDFLSPEYIPIKVRDVLDADLLPFGDVYLGPDDNFIIWHEEYPGVADAGVGEEGEGWVESFA